MISIFWPCSWLQFPFLNPLDFLFPNNVRFNWIIPLNAMVVCKCRKVPFVFSFFAYSSRLFLSPSKTLICVFPITIDLFAGCVDPIGIVYSDQSRVIYVLLHFTWFDFYFHLNMHLGEGNGCLHLSIKLIQVICLGLLLLHVVLVSWLSWGAILVVSYFLALN